MQLRTGRAAAMVAIAVSLLAVAVGGAGAAPSPPTPGTAAQVASLVTASHRVSSLPKNLAPSVAASASDTPGAWYPQTAYGCVDLSVQTSKCVFGATSSSRTIVLFGDSHAQMWLPALAAEAKHLGDRLFLLFELGCPDTSVPVWDSVSRTYYTACDKFRAQALRAIPLLHPVAVLLADRTALAMSSPTSYFSDVQWSKGLQTTLRALKVGTTKLVVLGDIPYINVDPPNCLATYPNGLQNCQGKNPNKPSHAHEAAEKAAAKALGATYVDPTKWLCTTICSLVIGHFSVYSDHFHVTATYAEYLSGVLGAAVAKAIG